LESDVPLKCELKISQMAKNATLEKLPNGKSLKLLLTVIRRTRLKCTKFDFGWGSAPNPAGELRALHRPLGNLRAPTSKGREREGREKRGRGEEERRGSGGEKKLDGPLYNS